MGLSKSQSHELLRLGESQNSWSTLCIVPQRIEGQPRSNCEGCTLPLRSAAFYRVPGLRGLHCSISCVETVLFGQERCRWCGADMEKPYTGIGSRLCSEDCEENYNARVLGDRSAALGSGKRLLLWLLRKQPAVYRALVGQSVSRDRVCQNGDCKRGENGQPASLAHLRKGSRFCSGDCRIAAHRVSRVPDDHFDASETLVLRRFSRNRIEKLDHEAYAGLSAPQIASSHELQNLQVNTIGPTLDREPMVKYTAMQVR